jgi:hypothetical protein
MRRRLVYKRRKGGVEMISEKRVSEAISKKDYGIKVEGYRDRSGGETWEARTLMIDGREVATANVFGTDMPNTIISDAIERDGDHDCDWDIFEVLQNPIRNNRGAHINFNE